MRKIRSIYQTQKDQIQTKNMIWCQTNVPFVNRLKTVLIVLQLLQVIYKEKLSLGFKLSFQQSSIKTQVKIFQ